ncbi:unnamed protein product [Rotaria sp. Silwood2]|nr:unnamed protein product [Rotaria sp. Silwood2]
MSSSSVDRMSGASTPTLLAMSSFTTNRLNEELSGLKRWRQMYDSAMNEKNEELQKLQLINQRQAQTLKDSIIQIEQQTMTINSMKQNEASLEKKFCHNFKVIKLEELHHILKKNVAKLEKTVSQCEFVRVDLERMYEHQERSVKSLADRVDSTIETKLQNLQSQLKLIQQLHEQARIELNKQIQERTQENAETTAQIFELTTKLATAENEINQLQTINTNAQSKTIELIEEINKYQQMIELLSIENDTRLSSKNQQIDDLQKRIDTLVLKIDASKEEIFNLQESNQILQTRIDEMKQKTVEHTEYHEIEVQARQAEIGIREKENEQLRIINNQLMEQMANRDHQVEELKEKNQILLNEINEMNLNLQKQLNETREQFHKQISDYAKQSIEYDNQLEQQIVENNEKDKFIDELKNKQHELLDKMELTEEEITQLTKENEELRTQNHVLLQESTSLEERLSKNQNLLTSLRSSMGEKDAKIKRLEQGSITSQSSLASRPTNVRRTNINHPLASQQKSIPPIRPPLPPPISINQQTKINPREKRMLPPPASSDLTSTPKKILRLSQTKAAIDQAHALEKSISPVPDDDRDEVASNTSVASLFEYLKKI